MKNPKFAHRIRNGSFPEQISCCCNEEDPLTYFGAMFGLLPPVVALSSILNSCDFTLQKERDLELAARIGQTLLEKNKQLAEQNELLEEQVAEANEKVRVTAKDDLAEKTFHFHLRPFVQFRMVSGVKLHRQFTDAKLE